MWMMNNNFSKQMIYNVTEEILSYNCFNFKYVLGKFHCAVVNKTDKLVGGSFYFFEKLMFEISK